MTDSQLAIATRKRINLNLGQRLYAIGQVRKDLVGYPIQIVNIVPVNDTRVMVGYVGTEVPFISGQIATSADRCA